MKKRNKGREFEKKVVRNIQSGGLWFQPLDINCENHLIECKFTDKKSYRITSKLLEKIWQQALDMNKEPSLVIGIKRNEKEMFVLNCSITIQRR